MNLFKKNKEEDIEKPKRNFVVGDEIKKETETEAVVEQKRIVVTQEVYDELVRLKDKNDCEDFSETIDGIIQLLKEQKQQEEKSNTYAECVKERYTEAQKIAQEIGNERESVVIAIFKDITKRDNKEDF